MTVGYFLPVVPPGQPVWFQWNPEQFLRQDGVGGWTDITRPRRQTALEWVGKPPHTMSLRLVYSGSIVATNTATGNAGRLFSVDPATGLESVEDVLSRLESLGKPRPETGEPPIIRVGWGRGQQVRWVIEDIVWESETYNERGERTQAVAVVSLREHTAAEPSLESPAARAQG